MVAFRATKINLLKSSRQFFRDDFFFLASSLIIIGIARKGTSMVAGLSGNDRMTVSYCRENKTANFRC
jgi:hypothetical protein